MPSRREVSRRLTVFEEIRAALQEDSTLDTVRNKAQEGLDGWSMADGLLLKDGKVFVPEISSWAQAVIAAAHEVGHEGIQKTLHRVRADFCIPRDSACCTCQQNKTEQLHPAGLLQSLEVPTSVWADIAMDFVEGLPRVNGKSVILSSLQWLIGSPNQRASSRWVIHTLLHQLQELFFTDIV